MSPLDASDMMNKTKIVETPQLTPTNFPKNIVDLYSLTILGTKKTRATINKLLEMNFNFTRTDIVTL